MSTDPAKPNSVSDEPGRLWVFTPSQSSPADLEFILVQRQKVLEDAVERVRESALTGHKHHLLFVGPRGCGKTHLVTLIVSRLNAAEDLADHLRIAWLNEDETCTTLLELLIKIHEALQKRYPAEFSGDILSEAYDRRPDEALAFVSQQLLTVLGKRTLVVVTENLDALFESLGDAGQKQLRAFIQENPRFSLVATAQRLVEDLSDRANPFFGFFQIEHLKPLNLDQATELLQKIARLQNKTEVVDFLGTSRGRARVHALHHLSGGNHRIYIVLSQFITRDTLETLLSPFLKMVDELTPYYQERIRWLPPLQRKIVEYLCTCETTVPVKDIARRLFTTPQSISSQLQALREKRYVDSQQRGREFLYEISEPLMRICIEVKETQRQQPLRLLVDFLRVWYDDDDLKNRFGKLNPASESCAYLKSAIEKNSTHGSLRKQIFIADLERTLWGLLEDYEWRSLQEELSNSPEEVAVAYKHFSNGNIEEAKGCLDEALADASEPAAKSALICSRAKFHSMCKEHEAAIELFTEAIATANAPTNVVASSLIARATAYKQINESQREIEDYTTLIQLPNAPINPLSLAHLGRALVYRRHGDTQSEIEDYTTLINLPNAPIDPLSIALLGRGLSHGITGDFRRQIEDFSTLLNLPNAPTKSVSTALLGRAVAYGEFKDYRLQIEDLTSLINLPGAPADLIAIALLARARAYDELDDFERAFEDVTSLIHLSAAPVDLIANALLIRSFLLRNRGRVQESQSDLIRAIELPKSPIENRLQAHGLLSRLHFEKGSWGGGFQTLEEGFDLGSRQQPPQYPLDFGNLEVLFSAGLTAAGRREKIAKLLQIYDKYQALPTLGESVIAHIGNVFKAAEPFPSTDNLEDWATAWEESAINIPDFRLTLRLLRTGVDFIKAGGKDPGILLTLTTPERRILEQAFGLAE